MNTYELAGILLNQYIEELSAVSDARRIETFELVSLERERQLRPQLSVTRERLEQESIRRIPAGRL